MRASAFPMAFVLAVLLAGCAHGGRGVPASAGFSTPGPPPEGNLSPGPQSPPPTTTRATPAAPPPPAPSAATRDSAAERLKDDDLPKSGDNIYVEELPEAIERHAPVYPETARRAGIDGTVMVQAFVLTDGSVGETRIVKSIPALDDAAAAAVKRWRFKPAKGGDGHPVAVWVGIPVRFPPK